MRHATARLLLVPAVCLIVGCLSPFNSSRTTFAPEPLEESRANLQAFDPFPRADLGPGESLRPRDYVTPRDTPRLLHERTYGAHLRQQYGRPTNLLP